MAMRQEELVALDAVVYRFPSEMLAARRARRAMLARRRRTAGVATVFVALALLLAGGPQGPAEAARPGAPQVVRIRSGDTLWGLAERYAPGSSDPRAYVEALIGLNGLDEPLQPGMRLRLP